MKVIAGSLAAGWNFLAAFTTWNVDSVLSRLAVLAGIIVSVVTVMYVWEGRQLRRMKREQARAERAAAEAEAKASNRLLERIDSGFGEVDGDE